MLGISRALGKPIKQSVGRGYSSAGPPKDGLLLYVKASSTGDFPYTFPFTLTAIRLSVSDYDLIGATWQPIFFTAPTEYLTNGDVEADLFSLDVEDVTHASLTREQSIEQVRTGTYSAKLIGSGSYYYAIKDSNESTLTNGETVTLSGYIYIPSGQLMDQVGLFDYDAGFYLEEISTLDTWVYFEHDIVVSAAFEIWFMGQSADAGEYFFLDDLSLKASGENTPVVFDTFADLWTAVSAETTLNDENVMGTEARGVAVYDAGTSRTVLNQALQYFGLDPV